MDNITQFQMSQTMHDVKRDILLNIDKEWLSIFDMQMLENIIETLSPAIQQLAPPHNLIFEAFRYGKPLDYRVVIIGQDPYPTPGEAHGLCFSNCGGYLPESLKRIFGCLEYHELKKCQENAKCQANCNADLSPWSVQGVLMLNSALTTLIGKRREHASLWAPFVKNLLQNLCKLFTDNNKKLHFLLWGNDAKSFATLTKDHYTYMWSHPSPMADNKLPENLKFKVCPHFTEINTLITPKIVWDNTANVIAFTDGACTANGKSNAKASFALLIIGSYFSKTFYADLVPKYELEFDTNDNLNIVQTQKEIQPSNNRGEMLGIIHALLFMIKGKTFGEIEIVSDSKICINTLTEWLPNRLKAGTAQELKNYDLVSIAWELLNKLRKQAKDVKFTHVNSHCPPPAETAAKRDKVLHSGNEFVDVKATEVIKTGVKIRSSPIAIFNNS